MKWFKTDLHIHSVLSPCGSLEMSPIAFAEAALAQGLQIVSITDHNSFANNPAFKKVLEKNGVFFIYGVEIQTSEEIHVVALFDLWEQAEAFGEELYSSLLPIKNDPDFFGDQVVINEFEEIVRFEEKALINSSLWSYEECFGKIEEFGGFGFPAHVDAKTYSVIAQLGFIPDFPILEAVGVTAKCDIQKMLEKYPNIKKYQTIKNSDAHYLKDVGSGFTYFYLENPTATEIKMACKKIGGRKATCDLPQDFKN